MIGDYVVYHCLSYLYSLIFVKYVYTTILISDRIY